MSLNINPPPKAEWSKEVLGDGAVAHWVYLEHPEFGWVALTEEERLYEGSALNADGERVPVQTLERISRISRPL